jgi:methylthioribose-1-phosphate isomerase
VLELLSPDEVAQAIAEMKVRGAPAIGIAGAYGMAIGALHAAAAADGDSNTFLRMLAEFAELLAHARPTAVNLPWAVGEMLNEAKRRTNAGESSARVAAALQTTARALHENDVATCRRIGDAGVALLPDGSVNVLTHCNTGDFATGGYGTALGIVRSGYRAGKIARVFVGETRPVLQGARLTTFELAQEGIPHTLITDSMAAHFMARGDVGAVIVGADRIAANGDVANKIGTYGLAVLARAHSIPFIVAAPRSSFDRGADSGAAIVIEERDPREVTHAGGTQVAPAGTEAANPAFDITPAEYVSAIVTEFGVVKPPYPASIGAMLDQAPLHPPGPK